MQKCPKLLSWRCRGNFKSGLNVWFAQDLLETKVTTRKIFAETRSTMDAVASTCTFRESARKSPFSGNLKGLLAIRKFLQDTRTRHYNRTRRSPDAPSWVHATAMPKKRKIRKSVKSEPFRPCLSPFSHPPLTLSLANVASNFLRPFHSAHKYPTRLRARNPMRLTRSSFLNIHAKSPLS